MERSGTLAEPSDNSTTPYIKKRPTLLGQPHASYNISLWIFDEQDIDQKSKNGYRFGIADKIASVSGLPEAIIFSRKRFARLYSLGSPSSIITLMDL